MDEFRHYGASFVEALQNINAINPQVLFLASHFADPPAVNFIAFPVAFFLNPVLGAATLLSINFSEWLNAILKWILDDDRPYWWVQTHKQLHINLKQFPLTCETGPGSPSGHCMVMTSGWLPLLLYVRSKNKRLGSILMTTLFTCTVLVAVSRVYIATHFPHQTVLGIVAGVLIGLFFYRWSDPYHKKISKSGKKRIASKFNLLNSPLALVVVGILSLLVGKAIGVLLSYCGVDVERSYRLATRYCTRPEWLHPSTSIMASYARITGALIGLAGALYLHPLSRHKSVVKSKWRIAVSCAITFIACYALSQVIIRVSPYVKGLFVHALPSISGVSLLFYMAVMGALPPVVVALVYSLTHGMLSTETEKTPASSSLPSDQRIRNGASKSPINRKTGPSNKKSS